MKRKKIMTRLFESIYRAFVVKEPIKHRFFLDMFINLVFLISLSLVLTVGRMYPLNYIANGSFIIMCILMIYYVFIYGSFIIDPFVILIFILNIFLILSSLLNGFERETFTLIFLTMGMLPIYFYFKSSILSRDIVLNYVVLAYVIFNFFFFYLYSKDFLNFDFTERLGAKIANQNDIATFLLTAHCLYLYLIIKKKYFLIPFLIINFIEMIATGSRSGLLNLLVMTFFIFFILIGRNRKRFFFIISISTFIILYLTLNIPQFLSLKTRFNQLFVGLFVDQGADASTANRVQLLLQSLDVFLKNPIFGRGSSFAETYTFNGQVAHNAFIQLGASYGLFVMTMFITIFVNPLLDKSSNSSEIKLILIISFLIFYLTLSGYYYKPPYFILPILASFGKKGKYNSCILLANN